MHERLSGSWHQDEMTGDGSTEVIKCVQPPNIFFPLSLVQYTLPKAWKSVGRGSHSLNTIKASTIPYHFKQPTSEE